MKLLGRLAMRELLILSGKGGTGKTTVASSFIKLSAVKSYADCDVDAPNLHLVVNKNNNVKEKNYYGMDKAHINSELCIACGKCQESCRFHAIEHNGEYKVNLFSCEACGLCQHICPSSAISMERYIDGKIQLFKNEVSTFSTAELKMGSGTSGMLVSEVKKNLRDNSEKSGFAIIDGSPGIGCPVIASISGVDMLLIVAEPSVSGFSDMKRIVKTAYKFNTPVLVCVNKYDINIRKTNEIQKFCEEKNIPFVGKIAFYNKLIDEINSGGTLIDLEGKAKSELESVYYTTMKIFNEGR